MTDDSAFKKQIRARMAETGETEAGRTYAAADEQGCREIAGRLLADQIEMAGFEKARVAARSKIVTDQELHAEVEAAQDAAIHGVVQRGMERVVSLSAVEVDRAADRLSVDIRAARPILLAGHRSMEADRLRGEMEELTGRRVRLEIRETPGPQDGPETEGAEHAG